MRFLGNIEAKIDAKGRVFLPAAFRKVLQTSGEEQLVLRKDIFQLCLTLYPETVWNRQLDALRTRLSRWDAKEQQIFRQFVSDAELLVLDANGRFLIPKRYLQMVEIQQSVKFIGMDDTIEVWGVQHTQQPFIDPQEFSTSVQSIMHEHMADRLIK